MDQINAPLTKEISPSLREIEDVLDEIESNDRQVTLSKSRIKTMLAQIRHEVLEIETVLGDNINPKDVDLIDEWDQGKDCYICGEEKAVWRKNEVLCCDGCKWVAPLHVDYL